MLFLSRQEVNNIMTRVAKVEECQKELNEYRVECEMKHQQGDDEREEMRLCIKELSASNLALATSINNWTVTFHDTWIKSRNAWITGETLLKLSAVVVAFTAAYIAIKDVI